MYIKCLEAGVFAADSFYARQYFTDYINEF